MEDQDIKRLVKEEVERRLREVLNQNSIVPNTVKQRHLEGRLIFYGLAADIPDGSTEVKAYFETDTPALKIWDGSAWQTI